MSELGIQDEVVMTDSDGAVVNMKPDNYEDLVLYKCEDCNNLFTSLELVEQHLSSSLCPAAVNRSLQAGSDGSFYIVNESEIDLLKDSEQVSDPVKPVMKRPSTMPLPPTKRGPGRPRGPRKPPPDPPIFSEPFPEEPTYSCNFCGAVFKSSRGLDAHAEIHQKQTDIVCDVCDKVFVSLRELKCHREIHTGKERDASLICDVCGDEFIQRSLLNAHIKTSHASEMAYACEFCEKSFFKEAELEIHLRQCPQKSSSTYRALPQRVKEAPSRYSCAICHKMYKSVVTLTNHIEKFHRDDKGAVKVKEVAIEEQVPCAQCYQLFNDLEALQNHECMALPSGVEIKAYKCDRCKSKFVSESFLELHILSCSNDDVTDTNGNGNGDGNGDEAGDLSDEQEITDESESDFLYCKKCGQIFDDLELLNDHINDHHFGPRLECDYCGEFFDNKNELIRHQLKHSDEDMRFACEKCPQRFVKERLLDRHMVEHNRNTPFECGECKMTFSTVDDLQRHGSVAHGMKIVDRFPCDECDQVLRSKDALAAHVRIHSGVRPFECGHCSLTFKRRSEIHQHMAVHTGERKFACNMCDKAFKYRNNLDMHKKTHQSLQFKCEFCDREFARKASLVLHRKTHKTVEQTFEVEVVRAGLGKDDEQEDEFMTETDSATVDAATLIAELGGGDSDQL